MLEKILVTSEIDSTELQRSMALRGKNSFSFRVMNSAALAETVLIRCGKLPRGKRVRLNEQQFVICSLMRQVGYFSGTFSFPDAVKLTESLNAVRMRFVSDEVAGLHKALPMGEFSDKNCALLEVYDLYISWLTENGRFDDVCLIRYAVEQATVIDAEFLTLETFALSPLEQALVAQVSGGAYVPISLCGLYGGTPADCLRLDSLTEVYGAVNEVDRLIKDIYTSGAPLDRCVVAVTDPTLYGQLFYDIAMEKNIPVAFGCGVSVTDSRPAGLLSLWKKWNDTGFHGVDALQAMVYSDTFDRSVLMDVLNQGKTEKGQISLRRLTELAGGMRFEPDTQTNEHRIDAWEKTISESAEDLQMVEPLRRLGKELGLPCDAFLKKYSSIRKHPFGGLLDKSGLNAILETLSLIKLFPGPVTMEDMIPLALEQTVNGEMAEPGKLFVTTVTGALSVQRDHLYILGLSADKFPGKPKENALMLDSDWKLLPSPKTAPTSRRQVKETLNKMVTLVGLANFLGIDVHVYWPDYDPADLKELIPSSMIYRLLDEFPNVHIDKEGYFPAVYSDAYAIGKLYLDNKIVVPEADTRELVIDGGMDPKRREWAPTAIDTWFGCKRKFLYQYILNLDVMEEDDPMVIISPMEIGNLAHHLMEILAAERPDDARFRKLATGMFDDYLTARPPMDPYAAEREKKRFVRMMDSAFKQDPRREVVLSEKNMHSNHPSGLRLTGRPDRVEAVGDGTYIVVDFKTGRKPEQEKDNPQSCRQTLIYAWMLQQSGMPTTYCEYRYLRRALSVTCVTNPLTMSQLETDLELFYNGLRLGDFHAEDGYGTPLRKNDCKNCIYKTICEVDKTREVAWQ